MSLLQFLADSLVSVHLPGLWATHQLHPCFSSITFTDPVLEENLSPFCHMPSATLFLPWLSRIPTKHLKIKMSLFLKKILFIYSWETHRERQRHRQREKQASCGEPDVGLDPRTPGSRSEPKTDTQPLSRPRAPKMSLLVKATSS